MHSSFASENANRGNGDVLVAPSGDGGRVSEDDIGATMGALPWLSEWRSEEVGEERATERKRERPVQRLTEKKLIGLFTASFLTRTAARSGCPWQQECGQGERENRWVWVIALTLAP